MLYDIEYPKIYTASNNVIEILNQPIKWFKPSQTTLGQIVSYLFKIRPKEEDGVKNMKIQIIKMNNGSEIKLAMNASSKTPKAVVLYLHTVAGTYIQAGHLSRLLDSENISYVSYTRAGNDKKLKCTQYNFIGSISELEIIIQYINTVFPNTPIHAVGASAGAALLTRYLAKHNQNKQISSAVLVSPGYDFINAMKSMNRFSKSYLLNRMKFTIQEFTSKEDLKGIRSFEDWMHFQSKVLKYNNVDKYIEDHNPCNFVHMINVPTLCLSSLDDPIFVKKETCKYLNLPTINHNITIVTTKQGGHVMFNDSGHDVSWYIRVIYHWVLSAKSKK